ncbi:UNVERIFIED_ORG: hypothetical protein GGI57_000416 [Rhizobium aethiopicum]
MNSGGPFRVLNGLLTRAYAFTRLVLTFALWAILLILAAIILVPMLLLATRALVLPMNETREEIYNLACSKGLSSGSLAERELIWRRRRLVELSHPIRVVLASQPYDIPWATMLVARIRRASTARHENKPLSNFGYPASICPRERSSIAERPTDQRSARGQTRDLTSRSWKLYGSSDTMTIVRTGEDRLNG